jgi:hypothetical protein
MTTWKNASSSDLQTYESIAKVFEQHSYLLDLFFEKETPRIRLQSEKMLQQVSDFSHGEIILVKVALDIWSGSGNAFVWEMIEVLDQQNFFNVLTGLASLRKNRG